MIHPRARKSSASLSSRQRSTQRRRVWRVALLSLFTVALALAAFGVLAAPGDLDLTFSMDGKVTTPILAGDDSIKAIALQPDGKIVAVGTAVTATVDDYDFAVARYNADGSLDTTFDGDGKTTLDFFGGFDEAFGVALQPDGKIVVAGYAAAMMSHSDFAIVRYNTDGTLDTTFDGDGKLVTSITPGDDVANAVAVQPDGKIVAAGIALDVAIDFALARYNPDGSLDTAFDADGKVTTEINDYDGIQAIALQADGKIVAVGHCTGPGENAFDWAIARYNPNGSLDTSFDTDGKIITGFSPGGNDTARAVAIQPDGKIVVGGNDDEAVHFFNFALVRYNRDGSIDDGGVNDTTPGDSFGTGGKVIDEFFGNSELIEDIAIQPDGKIVAVGYGDKIIGNVRQPADFFIARYNTNGSLDTSFGPTRPEGPGHVATPILDAEDEAYATVIQPDGKLIVAGYAFTGPFVPEGKPVGAAGKRGRVKNSPTADSLDFALARYDLYTPPNKASNFDADRKTDIALWNPTNRNWYILNSTNGTTSIRIDWGSGALGDKAVPGDYDGDGKTDIAIFRPGEGNWYIVRSSDGVPTIRNWGDASDIPVAGDYDLDGKTDVAVYRPSEGNWYVLNSRDNTVRLRQLGQSGDTPVPADYDGDGQTDFAVWRPSEGNWYIITSKDRFARIVNWGMNGDKLVPADYDGDGRADVAVFRPGNGNWYIRHWTNTATMRGWGNSTDTPVPADYDGDGRADIAVFRPSDANWYIIESSTNTSRRANLGQNGVPVPSAYLPQ